MSEQAFDRLSGQGAFWLEANHPGSPHRFGLAKLDEPGGIALAVLRLAEVNALAWEADSVWLVYQICAPIQDVAERLTQRGTSETERQLCLTTFHAERVGGTWASHRTFLNHGPTNELIAAVSRAVTADFGCGPAEARGPIPTLGQRSGFLASR